MISIEEAQEILGRMTFQPGTEEVPLENTLGRVLAQDVVSAIYMPPFDKSAMDGYAYISGDDSEAFEVIETIAAGSAPVHTVKKGQCAKIMTGAMLPPGADRVVKVEVTEENAGAMRFTGEDNRVNVCYKGEDIKPGDTVLKSGCMIRPPETGIIASMGLDAVDVYKRTTVGIITTGSEIKEPGQTLEQGQIYNSNGHSLSAQVKQTGAEVKYAGIVGDDAESITQTLAALLDETRIVLISGGVSMGDYDFVPGILEELGVTLHFSKVAIKPGKPTVFGTRGDKIVFGMPGNPVSTFTVFEIFVKPLLYRTMGLEFKAPSIKGVIIKDMQRKHTTRDAYVPVYYNEQGIVEPVEYHGSAHFSALARANGLIKFPKGEKFIRQGSAVNVRQI
jgi:molybdopterin molybdotransferase